MLMSPGTQLRSSISRRSRTRSRSRFATASRSRRSAGPSAPTRPSAWVRADVCRRQVARRQGLLRLGQRGRRLLPVPLGRHRPVLLPLGRLPVRPPRPGPDEGEDQHAGRQRPPPATAAASAARPPAPRPPPGPAPPAAAGSSTAARYAATAAATRPASAGRPSRSGARHRLHRATSSGSAPHASSRAKASSSCPADGPQADRLGRPVPVRRLAGQDRRTGRPRGRTRRPARPPCSTSPAGLLRAA